MKFRFISVVTILITMTSIFGSGCMGDRELTIHGSVYEWIDAPGDAVGMVYIDRNIPAGMELERLPDASVSLWEEGSIQNPDMLVSEFDTTLAGNFYEYLAVPPFHLSIIVKIEKDGYYTVTREFEHGWNEPVRSLYILLIRKHG